MERTRRVRVLITRARDIVQSDGDQAEAVRAMDEALELLRKIGVDMSRFRDLLAKPFRLSEHDLPKG
jgi:hypothetical protein